MDENTAAYPCCGFLLVPFLGFSAICPREGQFTQTPRLLENLSCELFSRTVRTPSPSVRPARPRPPPPPAAAAARAAADFTGRRAEDRTSRPGQQLSTRSAAYGSGRVQIGSVAGCVPVDAVLQATQLSQKRTQNASKPDLKY